MRRTPEGLLVAKGVDRVELGGFTGGIEAEENSDRNAGEEGDENPVGGDEGRPAEIHGDKFRAKDAKADPDRAAEDTEGDSFGKKLQKDIVTAGAHGKTHTDFAGAFGHAHEHDVHDTDAADEEGNPGDCTKQDSHDFGSFGRDFGD